MFRFCNKLYYFTVISNVVDMFLIIIVFCLHSIFKTIFNSIMLANTRYSISNGKNKLE